MALIAMLAMAPRGERARSWLQDQLWGSRSPEQARGSLRRELCNLRKALNGGGAALLSSNSDRVCLDLEAISVDARAAYAAGERASGTLIRGEFLEGLDIGEDGFEEWLREQRAELAERRKSRVEAAVPAVRAIEPLPARILDLAAPAPGFGGRPAVAVLAFANLTGEADNDYLAEGLGEDLIDRLSRLRWLPVIARGSSFAIRDGATDAEAVGQRLGAKYLFQGRLRGGVGAYNLAVELTDAPTRQTLWSRRINMPQILSESARASLAAELVAALEARIDHAEQAAARAKPPERLDVRDLLWRGRWHFNRLTRADALTAQRLFKEALAREPDSVEARVHVAWAMERALWAQRGSAAAIEALRGQAQQIISLDGEDARGYMLAGIAELWLRRADRAKILLGRALDLNPSLVQAHANLGCAAYLSGNPAAALAPLGTALRLSPAEADLFFLLGELAVSHDLLGQWREAVDHAEQSIVRRPGYWYAHLVKIDALARMGKAARARAALADLMAAKPYFRDSQIDWVPFTDPKWNAHFKEGLAMAACGS